MTCHAFLSPQLDYHAVWTLYLQSGQNAHNPVPREPYGQDAQTKDTCFGNGKYRVKQVSEGVLLQVTAGEVR